MAEIDTWTGKIHEGDTVETLREMPDSSVHMAMTSPPYFGLRDYDADGQIGLEETLDEYLEALVAVGDELRRVLRPDGSWWLNLGDSFSSGRDDDIARKCKKFVPHRTAISLCDSGWIARNDVVWAKPNPMPSSVTTRLTTSFEFVFHLTPHSDYWYDLDAIREPYADASLNRYEYSFEDRESQRQSSSSAVGAGDISPNVTGKNPGDVWTIPTKSFPDAHFAVYPERLCEKPIKSTAPNHVCVDCGTPYERDMDEEFVGNSLDRDPDQPQPRIEGDTSESNLARAPNGWTPRERRFIGWTQSCDCATDDVEPGIVLDPFAGSGTTCRVAKRLGRRWIGIDLNPDYVDMATDRTAEVDSPHQYTDPMGW